MRIGRYRQTQADELPDQTADGGFFEDMTHDTRLSRVIRFFTEETRSLACMAMACGTRASVYTARGGVISADGRPVAEDSVFDLASLSKLFTGLTTMRLRAAGLLDFDAPVTRYAPQFTALGDIRVGQVLGFEVALRTPERIDAQPDPAAAEAMLFTCSPFPNGVKAYSDIHAMVMRYILEGAAGEPMMALVERELLRPLGMTETWCRVPGAARLRCVSHDREHRIEGDRWLVRPGIAAGTVHDPKARVMAPDGEVFCGHAGLFSTVGDMVRLCQGILRGEVLSAADLREMARNRTGRLLPDGSWTQHLGFLCYVRHPVQRFSEVPVYMSDEAIALSGFVGNHIALDPARGLFEFYLGSRVMNRLSTLVPPPGRTRADYGLAPDGTGSVLWPGEGPVVSSVDFVYMKDAHYHPVIAEVMGLDG